MKDKPQHRARRHGRSTVEGGAAEPLGTRLAARFAGIGLDEEILELRAHEAKPAALDP